MQNQTLRNEHKKSKIEILIDVWIQEKCTSNSNKHDDKNMKPQDNTNHSTRITNLKATTLLMENFQILRKCILKGSDRKKWERVNLLIENVTKERTVKHVKKTNVT